MPLWQRENKQVWLFIEAKIQQMNFEHMGSLNCFKFSFYTRGLGAWGFSTVLCLFYTKVVPEMCCSASKLWPGDQGSKLQYKLCWVTNKRLKWCHRHIKTEHQILKKTINKRKKTVVATKSYKGSSGGNKTLTKERTSWKKQGSVEMKEDWINRTRLMRNRRHLNWLKTAHRWRWAWQEWQEKHWGDDKVTLRVDE